MTRKFWLLSVVATLLLSLPISTFAQGTSFQFDIRGTDTGLYSHTAPTPLLDWTYLGGQLPPPTVDEESDVIAMDADSSGTLFGVDVFLGILGTINPVTGDFTTVATLNGDIPGGDPLSSSVQAMTIDGSDVAWISDGDGLWMMDLSTATCVLVAAQFTNTVGGAAVPDVFELAADGSGNFFAFDITLDTLWELDETNGDVTALGVYPGPGNPDFSNNGMDFDPDTGILYGDVYTGGGTGNYGTWNTTTGVFTSILLHSAYPLTDNRVGGPIANFGGTCYQMDFYLDRWLTFDIGNPGGGIVEAPQPTATQLFAMDFNETGTLVVVDSGGRQVGTMDTTNGVYTAGATLTGDLSPFSTVVGVSCDPTSGTFYAATTTSLFTLDPDTGVTAFVADFEGEPLGNEPDTIIELAFDNSGDLYIWTVGDDALYRTDKTTGVSTFLSFAPTGFDTNFIQGLDVDPVTDVLYGSILDVNGDGLYGTFDKTTGVFTTISDFLDLPPDSSGSSANYEFKLAISDQPPAIGICPDTATVTAGAPISGSSADICDEDSAIWTVQSLTFAAAFSPAPIAITFEGTANPVVGGTDVTLRLVGGPEFGNGAAFIQLRMFNFTTGTYVGMPFIAQPDSDNTVYESTRSVADFVGPNGELQAEITCAKTVAGPVRLRMDQVEWVIQ